MKKQLTTFLFFFLLFKAAATHIVGGGFSYTQINNTQFRFTLTLYFDYINGSIGAKDQVANCHIYEKRRNIYKTQLSLPLVDSSQFLNYSNPNCDGQIPLRVQVMVYSSLVSLPTNTYGDSLGYYLIWERCCRNNIISNIVNPQDAGQTFYMEFPPLIRNQTRFSNSSPVFKKLFLDYGCLNRNFFLDFGASDADGDSLAFDLVSPINGNSTAQQPRDIPPVPGPYQNVLFRPGLSGAYPIPGSPGLRVDALTGLVTIRPTQTGLFVYAVRCQEYRNRRKIGEVRLEMQTYVLDCPANPAPDLQVKDSTRNRFLAQNDTLFLKTDNKSVCQTVLLSDRSARGQNLTFAIIPISPNTPQEIRNTKVQRIGNNSDTVRADFCFPGCFFAPRSAPWKIRLLVSDAGCSQAQRDTLDLFVVVEPKATFDPIISWVQAVPETLELGQTQRISLPIRGTYPENANLRFISSLESSAGLSLTGQDTQLPDGSGENQIQDVFTTIGICEVPPDSLARLMVIVEAKVCAALSYDTLYQWFKIIPKELTKTLSSTWTGSPEISLKEFENVAFTLNATVDPAIPIQIKALGDATLQPGFSFAFQPGNGASSGQFKFEVLCGGKSGTYLLMFKTEVDYCGVIQSDSIAYQLNLRYTPDSLGIIPNFLTLNEDDKNEDLRMDNILPKDNCLYQFEFVEVYNRWGKRVFYSSDRNFLWRPGADEEGNFFYALHLGSKTVRSWISFVR
jgi:hypothetical protein